METVAIKCNLIIDSCCDLPHDVVDREGVYLVNFPYFDDDGEHLDDLYQSNTAHDFYEGMRNGSEPHTAQVPMQTLQEAYQWAIDQGLPTVYLSFSSGLSGTFDTAAMLLEQVKSENPDLELYLVDTKLASVAEALLVLKRSISGKRVLVPRKWLPGLRKHAILSMPSLWWMILKHCAVADVFLLRLRLRVQNLT